MKLYLYYIVLQLRQQEADQLDIFDQKEAMQFRWINEHGKRVWVEGKERQIPTFVWGFDNLDTAEDFYETISSYERHRKPTPPKP